MSDVWDRLLMHSVQGKDVQTAIQLGDPGDL